MSALFASIIIVSIISIIVIVNNSVNFVCCKLESN